MTSEKTKKSDAAAHGDTTIFREVRLQVVGEETVDALSRGTVPCWIVRLDDEEKWVLWISKTRRPNPVVQLRLESAAGLIRWFRPTAT